MPHYYETAEERELRALRAMSPECLTPEERERLGYTVMTHYFDASLPYIPRYSVDVSIGSGSQAWPTELE